MRSGYVRRGLAVPAAVVGLCLLGFGALIYAFFVWLAYDQSGAAELCQARLSGPSGVGEPEATTKPGFFPISARCEWSGKTSDIELVSPRTTVIPVVIMGAWLAVVLGGGLVLRRAWTGR
jgi:hypothetical protein